MVYGAEEKRKLSFTLASWGGRVILANGVSPSPKKNYSVGGATHAWDSRRPAAIYL